MDRTILCCTVLLVGSTLVAGAQNAAPAKPGGIKLSDVAGTWEGKSMVGSQDSVVVTWVLKATSNRKGWTLKRGNRAPVPVRILAIGGDSVVYEGGPYLSFLKPGQMATTHTVGHYRGETMTGTWEARYRDGDVRRGKIEATRKK